MPALELSSSRSTAISRTSASRRSPTRTARDADFAVAAPDLDRSGWRTRARPLAVRATAAQPELAGVQARRRRCTCVARFAAPRRADRAAALRQQFSDDIRTALRPLGRCRPRRSLTQDRPRGLVLHGVECARRTRRAHRRSASRRPAALSPHFASSASAVCELLLRAPRRRCPSPARACSTRISTAPAGSTRR